MIAVRDLTIHAGNFALEGISFEVPAGGYAALMGKTGCGKTTIVEAICGLRTISRGSIQLTGRDVTHLKPAQRGLGYVPQDRALFNTMTVYEQLAFALTIRKWSREAIADRVDEMSEMLGIRHLLFRKPHGLSGGESQRVALGRALSFHPPVLLLDEPLAALDMETRAEMHELLQSVRERTGVTTLHITHDRTDAEQLAEQLFLLKGGKLHELSAPSAQAQDDTIQLKG